MDKRCGILFVSVTILVLCFVGTASATNWSVDASGGANFTVIQDAINNAKAGDTILVYSSIYYEKVVVDKSVTLKGIDHPVLDASGGVSAITLTADGITLQGFNATNSGSTMGCAGIKVISSNNRITENNANSNNRIGIRLSYSCNNNTITGNNASNNNGTGIVLYDSCSNNTITGNNASNNNSTGILLYDSCSNNTITGNNASNNNGIGIILSDSCNNNTITGNNASNNSQGIWLYDSCNNNSITGNNASNNLGGIRLSHSSNNIITDNRLSNNYDGIRLSYSSNNIITDNRLSNNYDGISFFYSSNNSITGNNVSDSSTGIRLYDSCNNNFITGNNVSNNYDGICLRDSSYNIIKGNTLVNDGLHVYESYQNSVEDNSVNGKPLVYLEDVSDYKVEDAGQVILVNCNNITVKNLVLSNTRVGAELLKTRNSRISNNTVCNNMDGIYIDSSSNNTITGNNVSNNIARGIYLSDSINNHIYLNNFINNTDNVDYYKSSNIWNSPLEITYTYDGTTYKSYLGSYWDDYEGTDAEGDGIGNTHYSIDSDSDESDDYPLIKPFENYILL